MTIKTKLFYATFFILTFLMISININMPKSFGASKLQIGTSYNETWGKYGTNYSTSLIYIPLNISYYPNRSFNFQATIPYMQVHKQSSIVLVNNIPVKKAGASTSTTERGLGDIVLTGNYNVTNQATNPSFPTLTATAFVDLPTASKSKGLGTGKTNYGLQIGITQIVGSYFYFINGGYTVLGKPSGVTGLTNPLSAYAGIGKLISKDLSVAVSGSWSQAIISGTHDTVTGSLSVIYTMVKNNTVGITYLKGFTNASPAQGVMLSYSLMF
ncbi:hypothetical protein ACMCNP_00145 [Candidatus Acidulodesulfobacterium sp. H_13]|uniref:hypothetical protein n=1 Tax=Candidatus Acidulodesulfobacterium sp. H_13 TaxID=3395470 RepID=UPI003AF987BC